MAIQLMAYMGGAAVTFPGKVTVFSTQANHTYKLSIMSALPTYKKVVGWHPTIKSSGYCLPGEAAPEVVFSILTQAGDTIESFASSHTVKASLVCYDFDGRLTLPTITAIPLSITSLTDDSFRAYGATLPTQPTWMAISVSIDSQDPLVQPLWPVGIPAFLMDGTLGITGTSLKQGVLTNQVQFYPYLMASLSETTVTSSRLQTLASLYHDLDAEDVFYASIGREHYNAGSIAQSNKANCFVYPQISGSALSFSLAGGYHRDLLAHYPTSLSTLSLAPIYAKNDALIGSSYSSYTSGVWTSVFDLTLPSSSPVYTGKVFANYVMSLASMPIYTRSSQMTLSATDFNGVPTTSGITLSNLLAPQPEDVAFVVFDPTDSTYTALLDPITNPDYNFFIRPTVSTPKAVGASVIVPVELVIDNITGLPNPLPTWTGSVITMPLYMVKFNGYTWDSYTTVDEIPFTVANSTLTLINPSATVTTRHQSQTGSLTGPYTPMVVTGDATQASLM